MPGRGPAKTTTGRAAGRGRSQADTFPLRWSLRGHMLSPTGIIPESMMYPEKLGEVMALLKEMVQTGTWKREVLHGWARVVGSKISQAQYRAVYDSGYDHWGLGT